MLYIINKLFFLINYIFKNSKYNFCNMSVFSCRFVVLVEKILIDKLECIMYSNNVMLIVELYYSEVCFFIYIC